jgi:hypothetical protein
LGKHLKLILKNQATGREATPWLDSYRERFGKAAKEAALELKDSPLKGAEKVRAINHLISEKLKPRPPAPA